MKRNHFIARKGRFSLAIMALGGGLLLASCAESGFNENEKWDSGVTGAQLTSPELTTDCFKKVAASDGTDKLQVSWKVVYGAGGYECKAFNIDDPDNPVEVAADTIDGTSFQFAVDEDTNYKVAIRTLGNARNNNADAAEASEMSYSTMVPATVIPAGSDIAEFINANLQNSSDEQAFELEAGGEYTMNSSIDFQANKMTLRGGKLKHATVTMGESAVLFTSAQLKVKFINFDCSSVKHKGGIIELSENPPSECSAEAQGIGAGKNSNKPADVYVLQDPVIIQDCAFKNVPCCLFAAGQGSWGIADVRVLNSVVQMKCDGSIWSDAAIICGYTLKGKAPSGGSFWYGGIKSMTIKNSTFYNTVVSTKNNRFVRFNNKDLDRVFPTASGSCTMLNNTFARTYAKKEFGNNTPNNANYTITFDNNIFYDVYRLQKFFQGNCSTTWHQNLNTVQGVTNSVDNTDKTKWATEEEIGLDVNELNKELDFSQDNYGINLAATGAISSTIGDPRWIKTNE